MSIELPEFRSLVWQTHQKGESTTAAAMALERIKTDLLPEEGAAFIDFNITATLDKGYGDLINQAVVTANAGMRKNQQAQEVFWPALSLMLASYPLADNVNEAKTKGNWWTGVYYKDKPGHDQVETLRHSAHVMVNLANLLKSEEFISLASFFLVSLSEISKELGSQTPRACLLHSIENSSALEALTSYKDYLISYLTTQPKEALSATKKLIKNLAPNWLKHLFINDQNPHITLTNNQETVEKLKTIKFIGLGENRVWNLEESAFEHTV